MTERGATPKRLRSAASCSATSALIGAWPLSRTRGRSVPPSSTHFRVSLPRSIPSAVRRPHCTLRGSPPPSPAGPSTAGGFEGRTTIRTRMIPPRTLHDSSRTDEPFRSTSASMVEAAPLRSAVLRIVNRLLETVRRSKISLYVSVLMPGTSWRSLTRSNGLCVLRSTSVAAIWRVSFSDSACSTTAGAVFTFTSPATRGER